MSYRRSLQPSKENFQYFTTLNFFTFFTFFLFFFVLLDPDPDPADQNKYGPGS
jgi:hypothetical protein